MPIVVAAAVLVFAALDLTEVVRPFFSEARVAILAGQVALLNVSAASIAALIVRGLGATPGAPVAMGATMPG